MPPVYGSRGVAQVFLHISVAHTPDTTDNQVYVSVSSWGSGKPENGFELFSSNFIIAQLTPHLQKHGKIQAVKGK